MHGNGRRTKVGQNKKRNSYIYINYICNLLKNHPVTLQYCHGVTKYVALTSNQGYSGLSISGLISILDKQLFIHCNTW